jgi:hypothetical protein
MTDSAIMDRKAGVALAVYLILVAVTYTYYSDDPQERRDITIPELAEEQLKDIESNGPDCNPELERRIRAAM